MFFLLLVISASIYVVFVALKDLYFGGATSLSYMLGNIFIEESAFQSFSWYPKTYSIVFYSILQTFLKIKVTPMLLLMVNKIISVFFLVIIFLISKIVFRKNWISLIVFITAISLRPIQLNLSNITHTTPTLFFVYLAILFLFIYVKNKDLTSFILSNICAVLAAYHRFELSFLFAIPYLTYISIFLNKDKHIKRYVVTTFIIFILIVMSIVTAFTSFNDKNRLGRELDDMSTLSVLENSIFIFKNNVLIEKDLHLDSDRVSFFDYVAIVISLILIINLIYHLIRKDDAKLEHKLIYVFAFFYLFYFIFQIMFTIRGLRYDFKYSVQYLLCGIIITYFVITWLVDKIFIKKSKYFTNLLSFILIVGFFIIAFKTSGSLTFNFPDSVKKEIKEMKILRNNVILNTSCKIIKVNADQPNIDFYFGLQQNAVFFGKPSEFYNNLNQYEKEGNCFYYQDQRYITKGTKIENKYFIELDKVDSIFNSCKKKIEFESPVQDMPFTLIRYSCG